MRELDTTEIEIISNRNNEQAQLILSDLGIDIQDINTYAGSIDIRTESAHAILIVRPKDGSYNSVKFSIVNYISNKRWELSPDNPNNNLDNTLYSIAEASELYEVNGYIILVIDENASEIVQSIESRLRGN